MNKLQKLENFYISKNYLSTVQDLENLLELKSLSLLDIQNNNFSDNSNELLSFLDKIENLRVLYLKGSEICRSIPNYRRTLIIKLTHITYLDDKPVKQEDRVGAIAYLKGIMRQKKKKDLNSEKKMIKLSKQEKEKKKCLKLVLMKEKKEL